jgi:hypothetical protein
MHEVNSTLRPSDSCVYWQKCQGLAAAMERLRTRPGSVEVFDIGDSDGVVVAGALAREDSWLASMRPRRERSRLW